MKKSILLLIIAATVVAMFVSCNNEPDNKVYQVTVKFDLCNTTSDRIADSSVEYGNVVSKPSDPGREGYLFAGWYFNEEPYDFNAPVTQNITLKAHWTAINYTVKFDTDGGTKLSALSIPYGEKINFSGEPEPPEKEGYTFDGWTLNESTYDLETPVTQDITLKATWTKNDCTVKFDLGDSTLTPIADMTVKYGTVATSPDVGHRTGYVFSHWKKKNGGIFDFADPITSNLELVAVWTPIKTNLTFYFPNNISKVTSLKVNVGGQELTFDYPGTEEEGAFYKYTDDVTGLDYGTYNITVVTYNGNTPVGAVFTNNLTLNYPTTDKELKVETSEIVALTVDVTTTAKKVSADHTITGEAKMTFDSRVTVYYSLNNDEPTTEYTASTAIACTHEDVLKLKVTPKDATTLSYNSSVTINFNGKTVGATGPAGGIIFYDAGKVTSYTYTDASNNSTTYSYRFMEAAPSDLDGTYELEGYYKYHNTSSAIGAGKANTALLNVENQNYAAGSCLAHTVTNSDGVTFEDWYLPSYIELQEMLKIKSAIGMKDARYWSSTETSINPNRAYTDQTGVVESKTNKYRVRPVRCF